jgi:hypothetical protein
LRRGRRGLGSARVSRVGFGVAPKRSFLLNVVPRGDGTYLQEKFAIARTRLPTRETRALPRPARELHFHDLGFFVLEMVIDRFDEAVGELLHFVLDIA